MKSIFALTMIFLLGACGTNSNVSSVNNVPDEDFSLKSVECGDHWFSVNAEIENAFAKIELSGDSGPSNTPINARVSRVVSDTRDIILMKFDTGYFKIRPYIQGYASGYWKASDDSLEINMNCLVSE